MENFMKKVIAICLLMLVSQLTHAQSDTVMFTQLSGRGSANDLWVEMTRSGFEQKNIKYRYEVGTCATSMQSWDSAGDRDPAVMLYTSNWVRASIQTGQPCLLKDIDRVKVYSVVRSPWWVCRNKEKSKPYNARGVKIGYHGPSTPGQDIVKDINDSNGYNWTGIVTKGSGENLTLLINGEIDYGFIASSLARSKITDDSPLECVLSWKKDDSIPYFKDVIKMKKDPSSLLYYTHLIVAKNLTAEQDRKLREIYNVDENPEFKKWISNQNSKSIVPNNSKIYMQQFMMDVKAAMVDYQN
jgi:hypothetical protein